MQPEEIELRAAIRNIEDKLFEAFINRHYLEYLKLLNELVPKINAFLDNVRIL